MRAFNPSLSVALTERENVMRALNSPLPLALKLLHALDDDALKLLRIAVLDDGALKLLYALDNKLFDAVYPLSCRRFFFDAERATAAA